ncbi:hypothetical protein M153_11600021492 [Pseudoloma neurophilia]|uniref:Uncharacterized protein n=1 Tax=Pseudoloma neurophilia TaxID=146866 RepID=A0A0R0M447_9MICR|nr:hypothetical protein M153_11600021492 [Pseudoloma neurophilia]
MINNKVPFMKNNNLFLKSSNRKNYNHNNQMKRNLIQRNLYLRQELGLSINPTEYVNASSMGEYDFHLSFLLLNLLLL